MKKALIVLLAIAIATPAIAAVTLTGSATSSTAAWVGYSRTGDKLPRAFGLKIVATGGTIESVTPIFTGEITSSHGGAHTGGYGIFPGTISIDANDPAHIVNVGTPVEPTNLHGSGASALHTGQVIVALGALYKAADANLTPADSGQLFTVTVSAGTTQIVVSPEVTYRGGVVGTDANTITVADKTIVFAAPPVQLSGTITLGNLADAVNWPNGKTATIQIYNGATLVETLTPTMGASGAYTATCATTGAGTYDVYFKVTHWLKKKVASVTLASGSNSVSASLLNGDVNFDNNVTSADLGLLKTNYLKSGSSLQGDLNEDGNVTSADLGVLKTNYLKAGD